MVEGVAARCPKGGNGGGGGGMGSDGGSGCGAGRKGGSGGGAGGNEWCVADPEVVAVRVATSRGSWMRRGRQWRMCGGGGVARAAMVEGVA